MHERVVGIYDNNATSAEIFNALKPKCEMMPGEVY
jgi:hypothetical protein